MGFDISYHPIKETEIKEWYFDVLNNQDLINNIAAQYKIDEPYVNKYKETLEIASLTNLDVSFDRSHGYNIAIIQGLIRKYHYTRGSAYSFLIEERPYFKSYTKDFKVIVPGNISNPIDNKIVKNYSSGVFIPSDQVIRLLTDYDYDPQVREDLDAFFSHHRIDIFLKALLAARELSAGLLEATDVIEPNPLNLNNSACYSNLFNCDQEGVYLFKAAAIEQFKEAEAQKNKQQEETIENAAQVVIDIEETEEEKKGFWKKLLG